MRKFCIDTLEMRERTLKCPYLHDKEQLVAESFSRALNRLKLIRIPRILLSPHINHDIFSAMFFFQFLLQLLKIKLLAESRDLFGREYMCLSRFYHSYSIAQNQDSFNLDREHTRCHLMYRKSEI